MIFIENKYHNIYYNIINAAKSRTLPSNTYTETHHILPKSLGGTNNPENLVVLTAREHFICHKLLTKFTIGKLKVKMVFALNRMLSSSKLHNRHKANNRQYAYAREEFANEMSILHKGKILSNDTKRKISESKKGVTPWMKGKTHTVISKQKISGARKSQIITKETIEKIVESRKWYAHSEETKRKISEGNKGKSNPMSDVVKRKISETQKKKFSENGHHLTGTSSWNKGRSGYICKSEIVTCPHCGKSGGSGGMRRFHFDHCKNQ